jgi:lysophospholipase L1-like esterase
MPEDRERVGGRARAAAMRLGLLAAALGLCFGAMEIGMRLAGAGAAPAAAGRDRSAVIYYPQPQRASPWGRDAADPLRVAVIGDSIAEGWGVQPDDSFGFRLERFLNLNDGQRPAVVSIWARGGTSTYDQRGFLRKALAWRPHLVLLGLCLNDTEDWQNGDQVRAWRKEAMPAVPPPWLARVLAHSRAGLWLYNRVEAVQANRGSLRMMERLYDPSYRGWVKFAGALHDFQVDCGEQGVTFVAVIFPMLSYIEHYPLEHLHGRIRAALEREGIRYLDLLPEFQGQSALRLEVVPGVDSHPNEIAHRLAAEAIFEYLLANHLIDAGYAPNTVKGGKQRFWDRMALRMQNPSAPESRAVEQALDAQSSNVEDP